MKGLKISLTIYSFIILLRTNGNAWVLPMIKHNNNAPQSAEELNANESANTTDDPKAVIGIKIVKFTSQDPEMQIFDSDMDLARKFAFKEWQSLLRAYTPAALAQVEEITVLVPAREMQVVKGNKIKNVAQVQEQSKFMKSLMEMKKDEPQRVVQALADVHENNDVHNGLK